MLIRHASRGDEDAIWEIIAPVFRAGETYAIDPDISRERALEYWLGPDRETFVVESEGVMVGTYYIRANQPGGGQHVCNCGYMTAASATGKGRCPAYACALSYPRGFAGISSHAVQFRRQQQRACGSAVAVARFRYRGTIAEAFEHPTLGFVDAFVMYRVF